MKVIGGGGGGEGGGVGRWWGGEKENTCECALGCYMNAEVWGPQSMGGDPAMHGLFGVIQLPPSA